MKCMNVMQCNANPRDKREKKNTKIKEQWSQKIKQ